MEAGGGKLEVLFVLSTSFSLWMETTLNFEKVINRNFELFCDWINFHLPFVKSLDRIDSGLFFWMRRLLSFGLYCWRMEAGGGKLEVLFCVHWLLPIFLKGKYLQFKKVNQLAFQLFSDCISFPPFQPPSSLLLKINIQIPALYVQVRSKAVALSARAW